MILIDIFVGFSTGQNTGCLIDISAQLYPTMEREHIDMNGYQFFSPNLLFLPVKRFVGKWNKDLLSMCGLILRVYYDGLVSLLVGDKVITPTPKKKRKGYVYKT